MTFAELPLHHALLITHADRQRYSDALWDELGQISLANRFINQTVIDIDTARNLISWAQGAYAHPRVALLSFHSINVPAQNALLKLLEEPQEGVRFILVTSNKEQLLPTVLSRLHHVPLDEEGKNDVKRVQLFLATSPLARMKLPFIVELLAQEDEEGRKDRESVRLFLLDLAEGLRLRQAPARHVMEILQLSTDASLPSAPLKSLLEYASLLLPQTK